MEEVPGICTESGSTTSTSVKLTDQTDLRALLGEQHDIDHEFPEFHAKLAALRKEDAFFNDLVTRHDSLDDRIRELEERQQPISDEEIEKMKLERTQLKDQIYEKLRAA